MNELNLEIRIAKAIYTRRVGHENNTDEHFDWYFRYAGDACSSVHVSTVRAAIDDARVALKVIEDERIKDVRALWECLGLNDDVLKEPQP